MRKTDTKKLRKILEEQLSGIENKGLFREEMSVNTDERSDEVDQANSDIVHMKIARERNRETLLKKKIIAALQKMDRGDYGTCETCNEPIEVKRLFARPVANQCLGCKEDAEAREGYSSGIRHHKSLGESFQRQSAF